MDPNVGDEARTLRLGVGLILVALSLVFLWLGPLALGLAGASGATGVLLLGALYLFVTAGTRKCPLNALLGQNSFRPVE